MLSKDFLQTGGHQDRNLYPDVFFPAKTPGKAVMANNVKIVVYIVSQLSESLLSLQDSSPSHSSEKSWLPVFSRKFCAKFLAVSTLPDVSTSLISSMLLLSLDSASIDESKTTSSPS
ncbi:unnamed protein product [Phytophthora fragariaefolia]|uniref:Unnamed protein product n=1 Tax=Phytophthora fragariaefolia TaxID=1490495 RepID=A0A9W6Y9R1_9STRA|nr:unnamed protein product [Phytophthora fragariaefolia]